MVSIGAKYLFWIVHKKVSRPGLFAENQRQFRNKTAHRRVISCVGVIGVNIGPIFHKLRIFPNNLDTKMAFHFYLRPVVVHSKISLQHISSLMVQNRRPGFTAELLANRESTSEISTFISHLRMEQWIWLFSKSSHCTACCAIKNTIQLEVTDGLSVSVYERHMNKAFIWIIQGEKMHRQHVSVWWPDAWKQQD